MASFFIDSGSNNLENANVTPLFLRESIFSREDLFGLNANLTICGNP